MASSLRNLLVVTSCVWVWSASCSAALSIFWASDPVGPDETVLVIGDRLGNASRVDITPLANDPNSSGAADSERRSAQLLRVDDHSAEFVVPSNIGQGVYRFEIVTGEGRVVRLLNKPIVYWAQGDQGPAATASGWIRVFGRSIAMAPVATLLLKSEEGNELVTLRSSSQNLWNATFEVPADVSPGLYSLQVWNGRGDAEAWSNSVRIKVTRGPSASEKVLRVTDFGAKGDGVTDDTAAIKNALAETANDNGGTVFFPRGRYLLSNTLLIPRHVVVKGAHRDLVNLLWPDFKKPPTSLIQGASDFAIEDLTIYASNHLHVISAGFEADSRNIRISRVRVRASAYRGHISPDDVYQRMSALETGKGGPNGGATIPLSGENLQITDSDIYGSGSVIFLLNPHGALVARNRLYNGRGGWYSISGANGVIFEQNQVIGADLGASGGGINTLFTTNGYSENIWLYRNSFQLMHAWDREAMTSDGPGGTYFGPIMDATSESITLAGPIARDSHSIEGQGVFIIDGRGMGEFAQIKAVDGDKLLLESWLAVPPDSTSTITIVPIAQNYLIVENEFSDAGVAVQFYGTSVNHVVAGNTSARTGGFFNKGQWYNHYQPSWYIQYFDNKIIDGNLYTIGPDNSVFSAEAVIGAYGFPHPPNKSPLALGAIFRRNYLGGNAHIEIGGCNGEFPAIRSIVIEKNTVRNSDDPVKFGTAPCDLILRKNDFDNNKRERQR